MDTMMISFKNVTADTLEGLTSSEILNMKNAHLKERDEVIHSEKEIANLSRNIDKAYENMVAEKVTAALKANGVDLSITEIEVESGSMLFSRHKVMVVNPDVAIHGHKGDSWYSVQIKNNFPIDIKNRVSGDDPSILKNYNKVMEVVNNFDWSILDTKNPKNKEYLPTVPYVIEDLFDRYYHWALSNENKRDNFNNACAHLSSYIGADTYVYSFDRKSIYAIVDETATHYVVKKADIEKASTDTPVFGDKVNRVRKDLFIKRILHHPIAYLVTPQEEMAERSYINVLNNGEISRVKVYKGIEREM